MIIPFESLSTEVLSSVIEDWLSRQTQETSMDTVNWAELVEQVRDQLKVKAMFVTWDDESQTINLVEAESLRE